MSIDCSVKAFTCVRKIAKIKVASCLSVRPSVRMKQLGFQLDGFS